jgi:RPA family protein
MTMRGAQEMARKRWKGKTDEEKTEHAKKMSDARQVKTTEEQRSASASVAAKARWAKAGAKKAVKKATRKAKKETR